MKMGVVADGGEKKRKGGPIGPPFLKPSGFYFFRDILQVNRERQRSREDIWGEWGGYAPRVHGSKGNDYAKTYEGK